MTKCPETACSIIDTHYFNLNSCNSMSKSFMHNQMTGF